MLITVAHEAELPAVKHALAAKGVWIAQELRGQSDGAVHLLLAEHSVRVLPSVLQAIPGVRSVSAPRSEHPRMDAMGSSVSIAGLSVGVGETPVWMCGPCSVESEESIHTIASALARKGVKVLRGGAFKPRTSPYAFQGHGVRALEWMKNAAKTHGLRVVTEVLSEGDVETVATYADLLQVGSRNMQNFALLKSIGRMGKPVLLKRGAAATVQEWLLAGEYLLVHGASGVLLAERGIRGFDPRMRNLLDLASVALLAQVHRLPVVVDPSHATGRRDLVLPLARAALAAGAAGVMIEVHDDPGCALSDGPQALRPEELELR